MNIYDFLLPLLTSNLSDETDFTLLSCKVQGFEVQKVR